MINEVTKDKDAVRIGNEFWKKFVIFCVYFWLFLTAEKHNYHYLKYFMARFNLYYKFYVIGLSYVD